MACSLQIKPTVGDDMVSDEKARVKNWVAMIRKNICFSVFLWTDHFSVFRGTDNTLFTERAGISSMHEYISSIGTKFKQFNQIKKVRNQCAGEKGQGLKFDA